jgi:hypothetical protein
VQAPSISVLIIVLTLLPKPLATPDRAHTRRFQRFLINLFLGFHILAIACWSVPLNSSLLFPCRKLIHPYFVWTGLFQSWDTFAPAPWGANSYVEARLIYADGTEKTWSFPRMEQLGLIQRYRQERYRKFTEVLQDEAYDTLWPDVARHIARLNSTPRQQVKTVMLIRKLTPIARDEDGSYHPGPNEEHILYGYGVKPEDLQSQ